MRRGFVVVATLLLLPLVSIGRRVEEPRPALPPVFDTPTADVDIPLRIRLFAGPAAALGSWNLAAEIENGFDPDLIDSVEVAYELPAGIRLVQGRARWAGSVEVAAAGAPYALQVTADRTGSHQVRGRVEVRFADGRRVSKTDDRILVLGAPGPPAGLTKTIPYRDGAGLRVYAGDRAPDSPR